MGQQSYMTQELEKQGLRVCKDCKGIKPLDKFWKNENTGWYDSYCLDCKSLRAKAYKGKNREEYNAKLRSRYERNKSHYRDLARRSLYNLPLGAYDLLLEQQDGKCAICGSAQSARDGRALSIDHSEETGNIRGLLCTNCNQGIGSFKHNLELLNAAISYLTMDDYSIDELAELVEHHLENNFWKKLQENDSGS